MLEELQYWITERERIRLAKEAGESKPWSYDIIFQSYRFCNVRRMDDKVSRWLMDNWYRPNYGHPNMLLACALARQVNWPDTLEEIGFPHEWDALRAYDIMYDRRKRGDKTYTGAYMLTGTGGERPGDKPWLTIMQCINPLVGFQYSTRTMYSVWHKLLAMRGFSSFIAGQVVADLRYAEPGIWEDRKVWAPLGPGSIRGLNRYYGRPLKYNLLQNQGVDELNEIFGMITMPEYSELMDLKNCMCEFDKYQRTLNDEGRPRSLYPGAK